MNVTGENGFICFEQVIFHEVDPMADNPEPKVRNRVKVIVANKLIKAISVADNDLDRIARDANIITINPMPAVTILTLMDGKQVYSFNPVEDFVSALGAVDIQPVKEKEEPCSSPKAEVVDSVQLT